MYKGLLLDPAVIAEDEHFSRGCCACHQGDAQARNKEAAHKGLNKRPSDDPGLCGDCHEAEADTYRKALHYTTAGLRNGAVQRFSEAEAAVFDQTVFERSCRTCHASCGDCHVKGPEIGGISTGLLQGHRFVKGEVQKTCGFCHGGRVYTEFTGRYGVIKDVHYEKGMLCLDCHSQKEFHGDGSAPASRHETRFGPKCTDCHSPGAAKTDKARHAHGVHRAKVSCTACHALSTYKNCYNCHLGKGGESKSGFILGRDPRNPEMITTLRVAPAVKDTFAAAGIHMARYDQVPNYYSTLPHVIRKNTERTNNCSMCHLIKMGFLNADNLIQGGSEANRALVYTPKPIAK